MHSIEQLLTLSPVCAGLKRTRNKLRSCSFACKVSYSYVATKLSRTVRCLSNGRVHDYIRNGLESELLDPDGDVNVERKRREMVNAGGSGSVDLDLTVSFPNDGWTTSLKKLPDVRFQSIYQHFMEKSLVVAARMSLASVGDDSDASSDTELFSTFKGIDKGYDFFRSGHVQQIEMVEGEEFSFVRCNVLPSMKKCAPCKTKVCLLPNGMVKMALCTCTAGLSGCCNHVAALLYALEEFVRFGLRDEEESPTSRLCRWNRPRLKKVKLKKLLMCS